MNTENIDGFRNPLSYVKAKLEKLNTMPICYETLFDIMFSDLNNVIFEKSVGYRLIKTTYGESKASIIKKASAIKSLVGAEHNSVVGIYMDNGIEWIECFWATLMAGYRPILLNLRLSDSVLQNALDTLNAVAVISDSKVFETKTFLANEIVADSDIENPVFATELFVMSSGTTQNVKLCAYTANEFYEQIENSFSIIKQCPKIMTRYDGELKLLAFLPFYHIFGLVAVYIWFAFFARTFVQLDNFAPNTILNTIRRHKVTHIFAVPLFWNKVYEQAISTIKKRPPKVVAKFNKGLEISKKLSSKPFLAKHFSKIAFREVRDNMFGESVQFMITGGSEIKSEVISFFNSIGYHLTNGYGMTEVGITSVELSTNPKILNSCTIGKPLKSVEYKINDKGELLIKGKTLAKYIIEGDKRIENNDWFNTKDLAVEIDGRYFVRGRVDDLVISANGENLNPNLVEPAFDDISHLKKTCLVTANSRAVLVVFVDKYINLENLEQVKESVKNTVISNSLDGQISDIYYSSSEYIDIDDIKVNRKRIAMRYENGELRSVSFDNREQSYKDEIYSKVIQIYADSLNKQASEISKNYDFFTDGGGTSLDYFGMIAMLSDEFAVPLPVENDRSLTTVSEIHDYIEDFVNE